MTVAGDFSLTGLDAEAVLDKIEVSIFFWHACLVVSECLSTLRDIAMRRS